MLCSNTKKRPHVTPKGYPRLACISNFICFLRDSITVGNLFNCLHKLPFAYNKTPTKEVSWESCLVSSRVGIH